MNNKIFEKNRKRAREISDYLGQEGLQNQENPSPLINEFSPRIIFTRGELYKLVPELEKKYKRKIPLIIADRPSDERIAELQFVARNGKKSVLIIRPADISQPRLVSPANLKAAEKKSKKSTTTVFAYGRGRRIRPFYEKFSLGTGLEITSEQKTEIIARLNDLILYIELMREGKSKNMVIKLNGKLTILNCFRAVLEHGEDIDLKIIAKSIDKSLAHTYKTLSKIIQMINNREPLDNGLPSLYGLINAQESQRRDNVPDTSD